MQVVVVRVVFGMVGGGGKDCQLSFSICGGEKNKKFPRRGIPFRAVCRSVMERVPY